MVFELSMMGTGQGSTFEDPTQMMTTTPIEITNQTTGSGMTSSSSGGAGFYSQCAVAVIRFVGAAANGLILYAMVASKQHNKQLLIFSQNVLDSVSCLLLFAMNAVKHRDVDFSGARGYWLYVCSSIVRPLVSIRCTVPLSTWQPLPSNAI